MSYGSSSKRKSKRHASKKFESKKSSVEEHLSSPIENVEEKKEEGFKRSTSQRKRDSRQFS